MTNKTKRYLKSGITHVKYSNRKVYNLTLGKYVTALEVFNQFKHGKSTKIVSYDTGKDVTKDVVKAGFIQSNDFF